MKYISAELLIEASERVNNLKEEEIEDFINEFKDRQPFLMVYLMAVDNDILNQDERESLLFLGLKIWVTAELSGANLPTITADMIDSVEENNVKMIEYFEQEDEDGFVETLDLLMENHPQKELLSFVVIDVMEDEYIREENKGTIFINLKGVIECLDNASSEA